MDFAQFRGFCRACHSSRLFCLFVYLSVSQSVCLSFFNSLFHFVGQQYRIIPCYSGRSEFQEQKNSFSNSKHAHNWGWAQHGIRIDRPTRKDAVLLSQLCGKWYPYAMLNSIQQIPIPAVLMWRALPETILRPTNPFTSFCPVWEFAGCIIFWPCLFCGWVFSFSFLCAIWWLEILVWLGVFWFFDIFLVNWNTLWKQRWRCCVSWIILRLRVLFVSSS